MQPILTPTIYKDTLTELRLLIENKYSTVQKFAIAHKFDLANLYKVFNQTKAQEMSVGLFLRINRALGLLGVEPSQAALNSNLSLRDYLEIDNNAIFRCVLSINFSKPNIINQKQ